MLLYYGLTSLNNCRFVTGANWKNFEYSTGGPQQFLVGVGPHDVDQSLWASTGQNDKLKIAANYESYFYQGEHFTVYAEEAQYYF